MLRRVAMLQDGRPHPVDVSPLDLHVMQLLKTTTHFNDVTRVLYV